MRPPDTRSFATLVYADEIADDPTLLTAYASVFGEDDDATLLVYGPALDERSVVNAVTTAASCAGLDPDSGPDMVVFAAPGDEYTDSRVMRRCRAVLTNHPARPLLHPLPIYSAPRVSSLRALADQLLDPDGDAPSREWSYEDAIAHLVRVHGVPEDEVRGGSIPESALQTIERAIAEITPTDRAVQGLHVGNFVGVSLGALIVALRRQHPDSVMVSVDPNIPHRGVNHPQDVVIDLLEHFGLADGHLLVCGYSLDKTLSNDGLLSHDGYDPTAAFGDERAPHGALDSLGRLGLRFDFAVIDGNHEGDYLRRELTAITGMLRPGGLLALDDVNPWHGEISDLFTELTQDHAWPYEREDFDGRVGLLRRQ